MDHHNETGTYNISEKLNYTSNHTNFDNVDLVLLYKCGIPPMLIFCLASVIINVRVLLAVHWIRRPLSPTLHISLSLAAADALASAALGIGLFINSFLPIIYGINTPCPIALIIEIYRLSGVIITVFHLLALSINHYLGILKPLHYLSIMTTKKTIIAVILLWILPTLFLMSYFLLTSDENFWSEGCWGKSFLQEFKFRLVFSLLFFIPLILMIFCYTHILIIVRRQQRLWTQLSRCGSTRNRGLRTSCQQKRTTLEGNVKAIYTTLLILGSCMVGWMPALMWFFLICPDGCLYKIDDIREKIQNPIILFFINWLFNLFLILKTLVNPIIYSTRMYEIEEGTRRMHLAIRRICCPSHREHIMSEQQRFRLGYSGSSMQGGVTALCRLNGSLSHRSTGKSHVPNTFV